jgi:AraC-like DNA-binding protein
MRELTVAAGLVRGLMALAVSKGAATSDLIAQSGIDPNALEDQDNRIPFAAYVALMRAAKTLAEDPALALHFGETRNLSELSIVGLIGNASETMMEAFIQLNRYGRLVIEFDGPKERFRLDGRPDGMWMIDNRENADDFPELTESTFASLVCGPRQFGVMHVARAVRVTHQEPAYRAEYDRIFQAPVAFGCEENALLLDPGLVTHRIAQHPHYVFGIFTEHADALLKQLESSKSTRGRVEGLLMPILHTGEIGMDGIAAKLAMSRQTLGRRLKGEGTTFEKVLDELRHQMALHYLNGRKVSVNETAYLVGFSERAAFARAFKRWTGTSPGQHKTGRSLRS